MANLLQNSHSLYLRQHAENPVHWFPWCEEAFAKAERENKLIAISIGYSSCHWCHVMERESFQDVDVAEYMNQHLVNIKVDREERPDVDQVYIQAAMLIHGQAGWPLNVIALPNREAVYAGTYFPKQRWLETLAYFVQIYANQPDKLVEQARKVTLSLQELDALPPTSMESKISSDLLDRQWENWVNILDADFGGRQGAPKFIMPNNWDYLMRYYLSSQNEQVGHHIENTLKKISLGGIQDSVGGGFFRYSVDQRWHIPHFEKMLYDNAQLLGVFAQAYRLFQKEIYRESVELIFQWLETEMRDELGGYYSSIDADSEGEEGKFYIWKLDEIKKVVDGSTKLFEKYYQLKDYGNWHQGYNHLHADENLEDFCIREGVDFTQTKREFSEILQKLYEARSHRVRPTLDQKIISGWNALLVSGLTQAYLAWGDVRFLDRAVEIVQFIEKHMIVNDILMHTYNDGHVEQAAFLSDYAPLIQAYIYLYQATFDERYIQQARVYLKFVLQHFSDAEDRLFFLNSHEAEKLIHRPMEISDNVISSSNSILARCLWQLGNYFDDSSYLARSKKMLMPMLEQTVSQAAFHSEWSILAWDVIHAYTEVVLTGEQATKKHLELTKSLYAPHILPMGLVDEISQLPLLEGKKAPYFYVCQNHSCSAPMESFLEVLDAVKFKIE